MCATSSQVGTSDGAWSIKMGETSRIFEAARLHSLFVVPNKRRKIALSQAHVSNKVGVIHHEIQQKDSPCRALLSMRQRCNHDFQDGMPMANELEWPVLVPATNLFWTLMTDDDSMLGNLRHESDSKMRSYIRICQSPNSFCWHLRFCNWERCKALQISSPAMMEGLISALDYRL